jgi:hypothetical protein
MLKFSDGNSIGNDNMTEAIVLYPSESGVDKCTVLSK